jgi:hypothetical protein
MSAIDEFNDGLLEIESEIPQSFTWPAPPLAGQDYTCFASRATKAGKLEHFGFGIDEDLVIIVRAALFPQDGPFPERGQTVEYRDVTYRIDKVLTAPDSSFLRLACVNASRGS